MSLFALFAALLVLAAAAFLLPPLWRNRRPEASADRRSANLAIFRDQLAELEAEKIEGTLTEAHFEQARQELQRRLLDEVQPEQAADASQRPSRKTAISLAILLPAAALGLYGLLGSPEALDPNRTAPRPQMTADQVNDMVSKLAERLKANPDDLKGWVMLARSYKALGRHAEAAEAYGKAEPLVRQDAGLLADYAETLAMGSSTGMRGKPRELVDQALKLDADNPHALLLAGAAAMQAGNRAEARTHWEKLLLQVEPGSQMETMLKDAVEKLKQGQ